MPVPEFYNFIRPTLQFVAQVGEASWQQVATYCESQLALSEAEKAERIKSGQQKWINRVHWALTYLRQARLIEKAGRGRTRITQRGVEYLRVAPDVIKPSDLEVFAEFLEFARGKDKPASEPRTDVKVPSDHLTPLESIVEAHEALTRELADDLLDRLKRVHPSRFERIIVDLMLRLGYGGPAEDAGRTLGGTGDGGVDGVIRQDRLGLDNIYLQAKRYSDGSVGTAEVNSFIGALTTRGANKGVFITTSNFSEPARKVASSAPHLKLSLIDGRSLAKLMIEHDLGVALESRFDVKRIDSDFFEED